MENRSIWYAFIYIHLLPHPEVHQVVVLHHELVYNLEEN